jgi:hypothetical protein
VTAPLLQTGIYTVSEASRLTSASPQRIRRWLRGYEFRVKHGRHRSPAVWNSQLEPIDHAMALGFLEFQENFFDLVNLSIQFKPLVKIFRW